MENPSRHFYEELDALLDGRLDAETSAEIEAHLAACEHCRREFDALRLAKHFAATRLTAPETPADLRDSILRALQAETPVAAPAVVIVPPRSVWRHRRLALACAALLLAAAVIGGLIIFQRPTLPAAVARDYRDYRSQRLTLESTATDPKELEAFFAAHGVPFATRVFDLGMMEYRLAGGRVHRLGGAPSALFVYRGPAGEELVCQMFPGRVTALPPGAERRENKGIEFHIYRHEGKTAVFWQEGTIVCVLVSDTAPEAVVQLAFAKAMIP